MDTSVVEQLYPGYYGDDRNYDSWPSYEGLIESYGGKIVLEVSVNDY